MVKHPVSTKPPFATKQWSFDHVAHAVLNLDKGIEFYVTILGGVLTERAISQSQLIEAAFISFDNCELELITPLPGNTNIGKFLEKRGEGLHHICFHVPSIMEELNRLNGLGVTLIDKSPRQGLRNKLIAFLHPHSTHGVLVELCSNQG